MLAATAVQCALGRPQSVSIAGSVAIESHQLVLNVDGCMEEAITALICSGHIVKGAQRNDHDVSASQEAPSHSGVWILHDDELEGIWIQSSCGIFVDICSLSSLRKAGHAIPKQGQN